MPLAKKGKNKSRARTVEVVPEVPAHKMACKAPELPELRKQIENLVKSGAVNMVQTTINEAGKGHFPAMKYLFEMIGLYPGPGADQPQEHDSLAKTLLRHLGLPEDPILQSPAAKSPDTRIPPAFDTVE